ncbi:hypothetical protein [Maridesulfovibrio frigidus]|uniref:hypothetical protein n=1 Tax=Maridesulfovibrio frigidus TaxID=340956 RepID=UPI0004E2367D|nr:hypothetical protein [Maridesulfovibrio frigidus]
METIMLTAFIFGVAFIGLAIGVIFKRNCLRGSCRGALQTEDGGGCKCGKYDFDKKSTNKNDKLKPLI